MIDALDKKLLARLSQGLPLCEKPYEAIAHEYQLSEDEVLTRLHRLKNHGFIKRFGVIVKHRQLGYRANAMVVWDIPNHQIFELGQKISTFDFVNLCYERPRHESWHYNLYCMIHGKDKQTVLTQLEELTKQCNLHVFSRQILFSQRCFKQRGAIYHAG